MEKMNSEAIEKIAALMRRDVIEMGYAARERGAHFGPALSSIEIVAALFFGIMHHDPENPLWEERDRFVMSKGHACLSYYAALAEAGYFEKELMYTFKGDHSFLAGHPSLNPEYGIEVSTGSLGNGFAVACGMAKAAKLQKKSHTVFCLVGDGECNEGLIWEAAMNGAKNRLDNLIAIIDRNGVQLSGKTADIMDVDIADVWKAFGWEVVEVAEGNDIAALMEAIEQMKNSESGRPHMIIAETVKGKGISYMENSLSWHARAMEEAQYLQAVADLEKAEER